MKQAKLIKTVLATAAVLTVAAVALACGALNAAIRTGVETLGPKITGTAVSVATVRVSPFSGQGELRELVVANPPGFKTDSVLRLDRVRLELVPRSLFQERLLIRALVIERPVITYELAAGTSNCDEIMKCVSRFVAPDNPDQSANRRVQLDHFLLDEAVIRLSTPALAGGSTELRLGRVELRDLGRDGTLKDTVRVLAAAVGGAVAREIAAQLPGVARSQQVWRHTVGSLKLGASRLLSDAKGLLSEAQAQPTTAGTRGP